MKLPPITKQQQAILHHIYRHRFLTRMQLQILMNHKDKRRISAWLKDLREKEYIHWIYNSTDFIEKSQPAMYYLGLNGIRYLRTLNIYPAAELRKRYKEPSRQQAFIARCLLLADCCTTLLQKGNGTVQYTYVLEADYIKPDSAYHFLTDLKPQLCFMKREGTTQVVYLLEVFDATKPRYMLKKRLQDYKDFLDSLTWQQHMGNSTAPVVLLALPTVTDLTYAKRRVYKLLEDAGEEDSSLPIRFATTEQLRAQGVTGRIWEEL
jgi:hypothetical protein